MTPDGDHLAPVTPLFGAGSPRRGATAPGETGWSADEGWATTDGPGADEAGADEAGGGVRAGSSGAGSSGVGASAAGSSGAGSAAGSARAGSAGAGVSGARSSGAGSARAGSADAGSAAGASGAGSVGDASRGRGSARSHLRPVTAESGDGAPLAQLPTYAAFASKTEGHPAGRVSFVEDDSESGESRQPEPAETLDAATLRAEKISLHALSRRGISSLEMTKTLRSRDLPEEVVAAEVERLERVGLLDDTELAENLVRSKQERKGLGKGAITAELRQRGVAQEAIEAAIADIDDDEEQARADEWALKRAGQLRGLDQATAERRLNGFLMRRGYRSEVIRRAVERALPRGGSGRGGVRFD